MERMGSLTERSISMQTKILSQIDRKRNYFEDDELNP